MRPAPTRLKIALFGNFGTGNLGNDCTLQAMLWNLRTHVTGAEITCICPNPETVASTYNIPAFPIRAPFPYRELFRMRSRGHDAPKGCPRNSSVASPSEPRWFGILKPFLKICAHPLLGLYRWFKTV